MTFPVDALITDLNTADPEAIRTFWEVEQAAHRADRAELALRGFASLVQSATVASSYYDRIWLTATCGTTIAGVAELQLPTRDNTHLGFLEVAVIPAFRRRGLGRALYAEAERRARQASRTHLYGEAVSRNEKPSAATAFAQAMGCRAVHLEHHLVLNLPGPSDAFASRPEPDEAYETLTWEGACPDELRPAYLAMRNQMNSDVPVGEIDLDPAVFDDTRLRLQEERWSQTNIVLVAAARERATGDLVGYSLVHLPREQTTLVHQEDTLVMPSHRGHGLGLALKRTTLEALRKRHPERQSVHTWTAPGNTAMYRTNERFGFRPVEVMHEMEVRLDGRGLTSTP
ncbi:GNAT family N-acetyltransferase [Demetria terragena]|uniref:GNAT family N-acetyltransferase n=1 Tax=Demetria terragena TaxID=63959 RepID=UPI001461364E|nr:GNAT family N-acetyltransferase [Demetria terragena]